MTDLLNPDPVRALAQTGERRQEARSEWKVPLKVQSDSSVAPAPPVVSAWSGNISSSGISFRCRTRMALGPIVLQPAARREIVFLRLVRERKLCDGLWEYGATICTADNQRIFQLPDQEFQGLLAAFGVDVGHGTAGAPSETQRPSHRELLLSLHEITQDASRSVAHAARQRRERGYVRLLLWVALTAAIASISIEQYGSDLRRICDGIIETVMGPDPG